MNLDTVKNNAAVLFNSDGAILDVDNEGHLSIISNWNLISRLFKWLRNLDGSVTRKINEAAAGTLFKICEINQEGSQGGRIYINAGYSAPIYPVNYLGREMLKAPWDLIPAINVLAQALIEQETLYADNRNCQNDLSSGNRDKKVFLANELDEMPPYVIVC